MAESAADDEQEVFRLEFDPDRFRLKKELFRLGVVEEFWPIAVLDEEEGRGVFEVPLPG